MDSQPNPQDPDQEQASGKPLDPLRELGALVAGLRRLAEQDRVRGRPSPARSRATALPGGAPRPAAGAGSEPRQPSASIERPPPAAPRGPGPGEASRPASRPDHAPVPDSAATAARQGIPPRSIDPATAAAAAPDLELLRAAVERCTACDLCQTRSRTVFADGSPGAKLMFIGEAPGAREDATGLPFVGDAGQLLTRIIESGVGLPRSAVYIANVLKCRPPDNRDPSAQEKALCSPFLERQIELVNPTVLVALGRHAANQLLGTDLPLTALRGQVHKRGERFVVPTFHPAHLLRHPEAKPACWADIQLAMGLIGLKPRGAEPAGSGPEAS